MTNDQRPITNDQSPDSPLAEALIASRWSSSDEPLVTALQQLSVGDDLFPALREVSQHWAKRATRSSEVRQAQQLVRLHDWVATTSAKLTYGWPNDAQDVVDSWIGPRLIWWPQGIPVGRRVAWVSSRLGRAIDERPDWFAVLRSAAAKLDTEQDLLLTSSSTTTGQFLERAAALFSLRLLRIQIEANRSLADWLMRLRRELWQHFLRIEAAKPLHTGTLTRSPPSLPQWSRASALRSSERATNENHHPNDQRDKLGEVTSAMVSPMIGRDSTDPELLALPLADRAILSMADHVVALQIRPQGNMQSLLKRRLQENALRPGSTWLALGDQLVPHEIASDLQARGAVGWYLWSKENSAAYEASDAETTSNAAVLNQLPWPDDSYLMHWTRRRFGPWPDQSTDEFIDDLLLSNENRSHSAFATLVRIASQRRLIASSSGFRGGACAVCFSATSLRDLPQRRTFRRHRGRWDFELFGLCIRRDWLISQGARPVVYGDESRWQALPESDKPFWQQRQTRRRGDAAAIDWTVEAEWRVLHDLDLAQAPEGAVLLFAPSLAEAHALSAISPWPIVPLDINHESDRVASTEQDKSHRVV